MTWWQRQRVPLIALGVSAVAAIGVHLWLDVLPTIETDEVTIIQPGQSAEIAGQRISLTSTTWEEYPAPDGTRTLSILMKARSGADAAMCGALSLTETTTQRVWRDGRSLLDERPEGENTCTVDSGSYDILAVFVLPDDAAGPFELDMPGDGAVARFPIEP